MQLKVNLNFIRMFNFEYLLSKIIKKLHLRAIIGSTIHKTSKVCSGSQLVNVVMDKYSDVGYDCTIVNTKIGAFCSLGANITIGGASHTIDWVSTSPVFNKNKDHLPKKFSNHEFDSETKTIIGNDVWIGDKVLVKAGVNIGNGAVIGMGSVVTKSIPSYEIWAGNPARFIKKRFEDDIVVAIENSEWWNWGDNKIERLAKYFNNVPEFIRNLNLEKKNE
jgi:acetyltransferase-like isoleucine patch superfamily enzyme